AAMKLNPKNGNAYSGLAEVYLHQESRPQEALDIVHEFFKVNIPGSARRIGSSRGAWSAVLGDEAWAYALLGRDIEAQRSMQEAFSTADRSFRPGLAGLYFRSGRILQLRNAHAQAMTEFKRAIKLDPEGIYGLLSQQALDRFANRR